MSRHRDPLGAVEQFAIAEEVASLARHDLRNRLGAIRNARYFLERRVGTTELWASDPRVPKFFALIEDEIVSADAVIQSKLTLAELRTRKVETVALGQCIELAAGTARVACAIEIGPLDDVQVNGDVEELALALRALIENGGESHERTRVRVDSSCVDDKTQIAVHDDGPGIVDLEAALRPMFSTKPGRIGLGLNLAARIARRHGGALSSVPCEQGARVVLELPRVQP